MVDIQVDTTSADPIVLPDDENRVAQFSAAPALTVVLTRPCDQLHLRYEFHNVELVNNELLADGLEPPAVVVAFGSQHRSEEVLAVGASAPASQLASRLAGESRIAFGLATPVAFDTETLLSFDAWTPIVRAAAVEIDGLETLVEVPQGLALSPVAGALFHTTSSLGTNGVHELWTARLEPGAEVVALANLLGGDELPLQTPTADERDDIVTLTTTVAPAVASELWLSSHGAYLDLLGEWPDDTQTPATNVIRWMHRVITGRDISVEVTTRGFLAPFGHRASMVTVTERQFVVDEDTDIAAPLFQETYLSITEPTARFDSEFAPDGGRGFPFSEITVAAQGLIPAQKSTITWTDESGATQTMSDSNAWNVVGPDLDDLVLPFTALDRAGNPPVTFELAVAFIEHENAFGTSDSQPAPRLAEYYSDDATTDRREVVLSGANVAWAWSETVETGIELAATKVTDRIRFGVRALNLNEGGVTREQLEDAGQPNLFPYVEVAWVIDDSLSSAQGTIGVPVEVVSHPRWLSDGAGDLNFDLAFLQLTTSQVFELGEEVRGLMAIDLDAEVFNGTTGAGPNLDEPIADPAAALGDNATLLGFIALKNILEVLDPNFELGPGIDIPGLKVETTLGKIITTFSYSPKLRSSDIDGFVVFDESSTATIELETTITVDGETPPETNLEVELANIEVLAPPFVPAVRLHFERILIRVPDDGGVNVDLDLKRWQLEDELAWLQPLIDKLSALGDNFDVDVTSEGIEIDFSITTPDISLGVISVTNLSINAGLELPFDGSPLMLDAGVGRPERPVEVSLLGFDGSFYMIVEFGGDPFALTLVAVSAEASVQLYGIDILIAEVAINLGISGCFMIENGDVSFGGCLSLEGVIDLGGLVSVSSALVGSLQYDVTPKNLVASGRITYSVDTILTKPQEGSLPLGEITYSLGDPPAGETPRLARAASADATTDATPAPLSFIDRFEPAHWQEYTGAFA